MSMANPHIGSSFESFLEEEGIAEACTTTAVERALARFRKRADPAEFDAILDSVGNDDPPQEGDEVEEPPSPDPSR